MTDPVSAAVGSFVANMLINVLSARLDRHILDAVFDRRVNHDIQRRLRAAWPKVIDACADRYSDEVEYATLSKAERDRLPARVKALSRPDVLDRIFSPPDDQAADGAGQTTTIEANAASHLLSDVGDLAVMDEGEAKRQLFAVLEAFPVWAPLPSGLKRILRRHLLDGLIATLVEDVVKRDPKARDALFFEQLVALRRQAGATDADIAAFRAEVRAGLEHLGSYQRWAREVAGAVEEVAATTGRIEAGVERVAGHLAEDQRRREAERQQRLRDEFDLFKPIAKLHPHDLRFEEIRPGDQLHPGLLRPYHAEVYLTRTLMVHDAGDAARSSPIYTEDFLRNELLRGRGVVLLGAPLEGKSRTIFQLLSNLEGYVVLRPRADRAVPSDETFTLLAGRKVVLLLDDLHNFARPTLDLAAFCHRLHTYAATWTIAATCRSGALGPDKSEFGTVLAAAGSGLRAVFDEIPWKLRLVPLTSPEKERLAMGIRRAGWRPEESYAFPTPGHITMADAMRYMRTRFATLPYEQQDMLRAMKVLAAAGVFATPSRLAAVLQGLFKRHVDHLRDCLDELVAQGFLVLNSELVVLPEPAYLEYTVTDKVGRDFVDSRDKLEIVLIDTADAVGLGLLAGSWYDEGNFARALSGYNHALALHPDDLGLLIDRSGVLTKMGRYGEALATADRALELHSDDPTILTHRGTILGYLERFDAALESLDRSLALRPDDPMTLSNRGNILHGLERFEEALESLDRSLAVRPDHPGTLTNRATALHSLRRYDAALESLDRSLVLRPGAPPELTLRGMLLCSLGRYSEALVALDRALELGASDLHSLSFRAVTLAQMKRFREALVASDQALGLYPADPALLKIRTGVLSELAPYEAALARFDHELALRPDHPHLLNSRGWALTFLGRYEEALSALDRALEVQANLPEAWCNKGVVLGRAGRTAEARVWLCRGWQALEKVPRNRDYVAKMLQEFGFHPRDCGDC